MRTLMAVACLAALMLLTLEVTSARRKNRPQHPSRPTGKGANKTQSDVAYPVDLEEDNRKYYGGRRSKRSTSPCHQEAALHHAAFPDGALHCVPGFARLPDFEAKVKAKGKGRCYRVVAKVTEGRDMHPYRVTREKSCHVPDVERQASNLGPHETLDLCDEHVGCDEYLPDVNYLT